MVVRAPSRPRRPSVNGRREASSDEDETAPGLDVPPSVPQAAKMRLPEPSRPGEYYKIGRERARLITRTDEVAQLLIAAADRERTTTMGPEWIREGDPNKGADLLAAWTLAQVELSSLINELRRLQRHVQSRRMPSIKPPFPEELVGYVLAGQNEFIKELPGQDDSSWCYQAIAYFKLEPMVDTFLRVLPQIEESKPADEGSSKANISFEAIRTAFLRGNKEIAKDLAIASSSADFATRMVRDPGDEVIAAFTSQVGFKPSSNDLCATVAIYPSRVDFLVGIGAPVTPDAIELAVSGGQDDIAEILIAAASSNDMVTLAYQGKADECISLISSAPFMSQDDLRRLLVAAVYSRSQKLVDYLTTDRRRTVPSFESIAIAALRGDKALVQTLLGVSPNETIYGLAHHLKISAGVIDQWAHPLVVQRCLAYLPDEMSALIRLYVMPRLPQSPSLRRPPKREMARVDSSMAPFQRAAFTGDTATFKQLLLQKQYSTQILAQCLLGAAQGGHVQILQTLLDKGILPDFETIDAAIEAGQDAAVKMLIQAPTAESTEVAVLILKGLPPSTLKPLISRIKDDKAKEQCLIAASYVGLSDLIEFILETHSIPVGPVAIIRAVNQGSVATALSLIEQAQPLDIILSAYKGDLNNVKKFCKQKTHPTTDQLQAALFAAVFALSEEIVSYLLDKKGVAVTAEALRMAQRRASQTPLQQKLQAKSTPEVIAQFAGASSFA
jgi:hypothetical protein